MPPNQRWPIDGLLRRSDLVRVALLGRVALLVRVALLGRREGNPEMPLPLKLALGLPLVKAKMAGKPSKKGAAANNGRKEKRPKTGKKRTKRV